MASIQNVVTSSQSFQGSALVNTSQNMADSQDQSLMDVMNSLASHMTTDSNKVSQKSNPDHDSILLSQGVSEMDSDDDHDVNESLEMSCRVWDFLDESQLMVDSPQAPNHTNTQQGSEINSLSSQTHNATERDGNRGLSTDVDEFLNESQFSCEYSALSGNRMMSQPPPLLTAAMHACEDNDKTTGDLVHPPVSQDVVHVESLTHEVEDQEVVDDSDEDMMSDAAVEFDMTGMDLSWNSSQLKDLPQLDGAGDRKSKRLGLTGPRIMKSILPSKSADISKQRRPTASSSDQEPKVMLKRTETPASMKIGKVGLSKPARTRTSNVVSTSATSTSESDVELPSSTITTQSSGTRVQKESATGTKLHFIESPETYEKVVDEKISKICDEQMKEKQLHKNKGKAKMSYSIGCQELRSEDSNDDDDFKTLHRKHVTKKCKHSKQSTKANSRRASAAVTQTVAARQQTKPNVETVSCDNDSINCDKMIISEDSDTIPPSPVSSENSQKRESQSFHCPTFAGQMKMTENEKTGSYSETNNDFGTGFQVSNNVTTRRLSLKKCSQQPAAKFTKLMKLSANTGGYLTAGTAGSHALCTGEANHEMEVAGRKWTSFDGFKVQVHKDDDLSKLGCETVVLERLKGIQELSSQRYRDSNIVHTPCSVPVVLWCNSSATDDVTQIIDSPLRNSQNSSKSVSDHVRRKRKRHRESIQDCALSDSVENGLVQADETMLTENLTSQEHCDEFAQDDLSIECFAENDAESAMTDCITLPAMKFKRGDMRVSVQLSDSADDVSTECIDVLPEPSIGNSPEESDSKSSKMSSWLSKLSPVVDKKNKGQNKSSQRQIKGSPTQIKLSSPRRENEAGTPKNKTSLHQRQNKSPCTNLKKKPLDFIADRCENESPLKNERNVRRQLLDSAASVVSDDGEQNGDDDIYEIENCSSPEETQFTEPPQETEDDKKRSCQAISSKLDIDSSQTLDKCVEMENSMGNIEDVGKETSASYVPQSACEEHLADCTEAGEGYKDALFNMSYLSPLSINESISPPSPKSPTEFKTEDDNLQNTSLSQDTSKNLGSISETFLSPAMLEVKKTKDGSAENESAENDVQENVNIEVSGDATSPVNSQSFSHQVTQSPECERDSPPRYLGGEEADFNSLTEKSDLSSIDLPHVQSHNALISSDKGESSNKMKEVSSTPLTTSSFLVTETILKPAMAPPGRQHVMESLTEFGLTELSHSPAYCSVSTDVPEQAVAIGHNLLKVPSNSISELPDFDSQKDSLKSWQTCLIGTSTGVADDSFSLAEEMEKNPAMKASMLGTGNLVFTPCKVPPTASAVKCWLEDQNKHGKQHLNDHKMSDYRETNGNKIPKNQLAENVVVEKATWVTSERSVNVNEDKNSSVDLEEYSEVIEPTPKKQKIKLGDRLSFGHIQHSTPVTQRSRLSLGLTCTPIHLAKSPGIPSQSVQKQEHIDGQVSSQSPCTSSSVAQLHNKGAANIIQNQLSTPLQEKEGSQIEGPTLSNTYGFKVSRRNVRDTKTLHGTQCITVLSVEVHCSTRADLRPDPEFDPVCAVFYCIHDDRETCDIVGVILVDEESATQTIEGAGVLKKKQTLLQKSGVSGIETLYTKDELTLIEELVALVLRHDPDILVGYEIQMSSWGYLLDRAAVLDINLCSKLSRLPGERLKSHFGKESDDWWGNQTLELHIAGRVVINLWRVAKHEVTLNIYTFENVYFHVVHQRAPLFSTRKLTLWYNSHLTRYRVIDYFITRTQGNLQIIKKLDLIGQTSEFARIYGIEFYHVLSRGSQYRVESMMLRLAKPQNFIAVSPSVQQRAFMKAPECIALTMEPESRFYTDPVVVVDFQSLYPSIMIAYNYCFSTCLGRLASFNQIKDGPIKFGCTLLDIDVDQLQKLSLNDLNISPNGVVFVKPHIRKGVISSMVEEILNTRIMVKDTMKQYKTDKYLQQMLHSRQLGLKLIANVTYGYTSANFSGRMPCIEVADSIVRKARETLERAIRLVEETTRWNAKVVYGDTDSMFILLKGRSKEQALKIGQEIADVVTADNPKPIKLKFEKVYLPCVLQTKKRYVGFMYESADQKEPIYDAKGIETVRRDSCSAVAKILERSIKILFTTKDISQVKQYVLKQCQKINEGRASLQDLTFAKEYRGATGYKPGACVPALEISRKLLATDRRSEPRNGERVPYVIVYGTPGLPLIQLVRRPDEVLKDATLRLNATYYITKQVLPPLNRMFSLIGVNVFLWYSELPKVNKVIIADPTTTGKKGTIAQYFASKDCPVCGELTRDGVCAKCKASPQQTVLTLNNKVREWERTYTALNKICLSCSNVVEQEPVCVSLDCPVMYCMNQARRHQGQVDTLRKMETSFVQL